MSDARDWAFSDWMGIVWKVSWAVFFVSLLFSVLALVGYIALGVALL